MKNQDLIRSINHNDIYYCKEFIKSLHSKNFMYRASDLMSIGMRQQDIDLAVKRALTVCKNAGHQIKHHFCPIYTADGDKLISDCKLSKLAYALVLLNANIQNSSVVSFQMEVISEYLKK